MTYVYVNNGYAPYDEVADRVEAPPLENDGPPEAAAPTNAGEWTSPDGKRLVQIHGEQSEAFLYEKTSGQPVYLRQLGGDVQKVRFSGGEGGKPLRILVDFKNGGFSLFNENGEPLDGDLPPVPALPANLPEEKEN